MPSSEYFLQKVRCPGCVKTDAGGVGSTPGVLTLEHECWLACHTCARKYPIVDSIPDLTIQKGDEWTGTPVADLPVPPPARPEGVER